MRRPHLTIMSEKNHAAGRFVRQASALSHPALGATFAQTRGFLQVRESWFCMRSFSGYSMFLRARLAWPLYRVAGLMDAMFWFGFVIPQEACS